MQENTMFGRSVISELSDIKNKSCDLRYVLDFT